MLCKIRRDQRNAIEWGLPLLSSLLPPPLPRALLTNSALAMAKAVWGFFPAMFRFEFDFEFDFDFDFEFDLNEHVWISIRRETKKKKVVLPVFFIHCLCVCVFFVVSSVAFWGHSFSYAGCCFFFVVVAGTGTGTLFVLVSPSLCCCFDSTALLRSVVCCRRV